MTVLGRKVSSNKEKSKRQTFVKWITNITCAESNKRKLVHNLLPSDPYLLVEELQLDSVGGLEAIEATLDELTPLMLLLLLFLLLFALPMVAETEVLAAETETEALVMIVEELCPPFGATAKLLGGTFGGIGST